MEALRERAAASGSRIALSIYPWDIVTELETRLESPQAMLLVVPNGKVKLLNALPFAPADLRHDSLAEAWEAYRDAWRSAEVREFVAPLPERPGAAAPRQRDLADAARRLTRAAWRPRLGPHAPQAASGITVSDRMPCAPRISTPSMSAVAEGPVISTA